MEWIDRAFTTKGRTPVIRFALIALAAGLLWSATLLVLDPGGYTGSVLVGLIGGVLLAKTIAEGARRLHDRGQSLRFGAWIALALGIAYVGLLAHWSGSGPDLLFRFGTYAIIAVAAVILLWPGDRAENRFGHRPQAWISTVVPAGDRGGRWLLFGWALACTGIGAGLAWAAADMQRANAAGDALARQMAADDQVSSQVNSR